MIKMRVLCVNPGPAGSQKKIDLVVKEGRCMERSGAWSNIRMPITLAYISSILKKAGHEVVLIDDTANYYLEKRTMLKTVLEKLDPEIAFINTSIPTVLTEDMHAAKAIKENNGKTITVMVGVAPTLVPGKILESGHVDICIRKEPELIAAELCKSMQEGRSWKKVKGITFRENKKIISNEDAVPIADLDRLPMPDFDSLPLDAYRTPVDRKKQVLIDVSRGCPNNCIYCTGTKFYGKTFRHRRPEKVIEEIEYVKKLGVRKILFWADTFTLNHDFVRELCSQMIERGLEQKMSWVVNSRVNTVNPETLKLMSDANCFLIGFGVESGNQEILDYVRKGITLDQTRKAFRWIKDTNISSAAHVVFGLAPFETEKTIKKTLRFINEIKPNYANFHVAIPYPDTELYEIYEREGYIINKNLEYLESSIANISLPNLTGEQLKRWRDRAFYNFYFRPGFLAQELMNVKSARELRYLVENGLWFVKGWATRS
jgi:anaerobic magnesium-protoporphyrin IX monomethyl ester cyclase